MRISGLFSNRIWGFRLIEISGLVLLIALALTVYLAKVGGGRDSQEIARVERQIAHEKQQIRLLRAEVAAREQPGRIGRLSAEYLELTPATAAHEAPPEALVDIARGTMPKSKALAP